MSSTILSAQPAFSRPAQCLAALTNQAFPPGLHAGDAIGSFNSWMRLVTGILAGLGLVWFVFPHMEESFAKG